jgi:hypothetical protein
MSTQRSAMHAGEAVAEASREEGVERIEDIPEKMTKAFHIARSGRPGPVHVELPRLSDYSEYILPSVSGAMMMMMLQRVGQFGFRQRNDAR